MTRKLYRTWLVASLAVLAAASCTAVFGDFELRSTSGTGGAGGNGAGGGGTCAVGAMACKRAADCPAPTGECVVAACTEKACCATTQAPVDTLCPGGTCDATGACKKTSCTTVADCATPKCATATCDAASQTCTFTPLQDGTPTPGATQTPGDCHTHVCVGGVDTDKEDDTDAPAVMAAMAGCADEACAAGAPKATLHAVDSVCSTFMGNQPGFCDAAGHCVACTKDSECPGATDDCQHPTCTNGACIQTFTAAGTATTTNPPQIAGDCHKIVCLGMLDGSMNDHQTVVDDTDVPASSPPCLTVTCSGGSPVKTPHPGVTCGVGETCNAQGNCGCQTNADCTLPQTCGGGGTAQVCGCTAKTCATLGKTCGGPFSDTCSGMLACDDAAKNGSETDVDCGGDPTKCATRCAQGKHCTAGTDCLSGFCADGVCCNMACTGVTCQACSAAAKGQGADGVCGAVKVGADPHGQCTAQAASTCGNVGGCNGSGGCTLYAMGTSCASTTCLGSTLTAHTCNGTGSCGAAMSSCSPYTCAAGSCRTTCSNSSQCVAGDVCVGTACVPGVPAGGSCSSNTQCSSGVCGTNGTGNCCTASCGFGGQCGPTGCAAGTGACVFPGASTQCFGGPFCQGQNKLAPNVCDGAGNCNQTPVTCAGGYLCQGMACLTTCGAAGPGQCQTGYYCDGVGAGACQPDLAPGKPCANGYQCLSGSCVMNMCTTISPGGNCTSNAECTSGVCGGGTGTGRCCTGPCATFGFPTCNATNCGFTGACTYPGAGVQCNGGPMCGAPGQLVPNVCDGTGSCNTLPNTCAGGNLCSGTACQANCGTVAGLAGCQQPGYYCDGVAPGVCQTRLASGMACAANYQCTSNNCAGLICQ